VETPGATGILLQRAHARYSSSAAFIKRFVPDYDSDLALRQLTVVARLLTTPLQIVAPVLTSILPVVTPLFAIVAPVVTPLLAIIAPLLTALHPRRLRLGT
jgi:hypothetical protein